MINTWFIVFSSITLRQVVSYECPSGKDIQTGPACRLSEAQLDSFGNDKAFAQAYAMRLCEDMVNFYKNGATWEHAFGELGESVYSETTEGHFDTQRDVGYNNFKVDAMFSRNVAEPPEINCEEAVYNDKSKFLDRHIKLKVKAKSGFKGVAAKDIMFFKQYFFESDGTLRMVQYQSLLSNLLLNKRNWTYNKTQKDEKHSQFPLLDGLLADIALSSAVVPTEEYLSKCDCLLSVIRMVRSFVLLNGEIMAILVSAHFLNAIGRILIGILQSIDRVHQWHRIIGICR